jgi:hypothetical protein
MCIVFAAVLAVVLHIPLVRHIWRDVRHNRKTDGAAIHSPEATGRSRGRPNDSVREAIAV